MNGLNWTLKLDALRAIFNRKQLEDLSQDLHKQQEHRQFG